MHVYERLYTNSGELKHFQKGESGTMIQLVLVINDDTNSKFILKRCTTHT